MDAWEQSDGRRSFLEIGVMAISDDDLTIPVLLGPEDEPTDLVESHLPPLRPPERPQIVIGMARLFKGLR